MSEHSAVTVSQMKEIERMAAESGLSYTQMMENAGTAAAEFILSTQRAGKAHFLIFCGKGNNGGDGFVAARKLLERGAGVQIILSDGPPAGPDAIKNKQLCESLHIPIVDLKSSGKDAARLAAQADVMVDAIYGTGFHGKLGDTAREAAELINHAKAVVYSLDIPSGLNGDSGQADENTVTADYTIALHRYKCAHVMAENSKYCGKLVCVGIGI
jgi:NAD(P)H-hydrate epimerase